MAAEAVEASNCSVQVVPLGKLWLSCRLADGDLAPADRPVEVETSLRLGMQQGGEALMWMGVGGRRDHEAEKGCFPRTSMQLSAWIM